MNYIVFAENIHEFGSICSLAKSHSKKQQQKNWLKPCDGLLLRFSSWKPQFPFDKDTTTICATNWLLNCFAVGFSLKTMHALLPVLWGRLFLNKQRRINKIENPQELKKTKKGVNNLRGVFLLNLFWAGP